MFESSFSPNFESRQFLKRALPVAVTRFLSHGETYLRRLSFCGRGARQIRGRTAEDRVVLWRSLVKAPFEMFGGFDRWREPTLDSDAEVVAEGLDLFRVRRRSDDLAHVLPANDAALFAAIRRRVRDGDTEGAETEALRGATDLIKRINCVIFESWTSVGGEAALLLRTLGFQIAHIDGRDFLAYRGAWEPRG